MSLRILRSWNTPDIDALTISLSIYWVLLLPIVCSQRSRVSMYKGLLTHSLLCSKFVELTLILRIKVVLRRSYDEKQPEHTTVLSFKGLELNLDNKTVSIDGEIIPFTKKEFELLHLLLLEQGKVFSRNQLIKLIWSYDVEVTSRTVDVNITRIRKKIGAYGKYIITRPGFGYYFTK